MARRNDHSPEQLKQLTLQFTCDALNQGSADELSLRKIAKGIGYSPGTLINLFGSYSYLLLAANAQTLDELKQQLEIAVADTASPDQQMQALAHAYLAFAQQFPSRWRLVFEHRLAQDEALPEWHAQRIEALFARVEHLLDALNPSAGTEQKQLAARTLWASVHGICQMVLEDKLFASQLITGEQMINNLLGAYLADWRATPSTTKE